MPPANTVTLDELHQHGYAQQQSTSSYTTTTNTTLRKPLKQKNCLVCLKYLDRIHQLQEQFQVFNFFKIDIYGKCFNLLASSLAIKSFNEYKTYLCFAILANFGPVWLNVTGTCQDHLTTLSFGNPGTTCILLDTTKLKF